jgi:hypothetical protein
VQRLVEAGAMLERKDENDSSALMRASANSADLSISLYNITLSLSFSLSFSPSFPFSR